MVFEKLRIPCLSLASALILSGCGVYSFSGSMSSGIESIAVPVFENESVEYGIAEELTSGVIEGFVADNTLKVISRSKADAVLEGIILRYERSAYTYDENDQVQEYKVNITAKVRLNKSDGSLVWEEESLADYGIYNADDETEEEGKSRAIEKIAEDIVNRTVKDW
jgi:outer membrane lipopolysaccharide assembly protein LptE/RlpB